MHWKTKQLIVLQNSVITEDIIEKVLLPNISEDNNKLGKKEPGQYSTVRNIMILATVLESESEMVDSNLAHGNLGNVCKAKSWSL